MPHPEEEDFKYYFPKVSRASVDKSHAHPESSTGERPQASPSNDKIRSHSDTPAHGLLVDLSDDRNSMIPSSPEPDNGAWMNVSNATRRSKQRRNKRGEIAPTVASPSLQPTTHTKAPPLVREYFRGQPEHIPGSDWFRASEVPLSAELCPWMSAIPSSAPIEANKLQGAFSSPDEYLRIHHNLLREDTIRPLRESLAIIKENPAFVEHQFDSKTIGLYEKVRPIAVTYSPRGLAVRVAFSMARVGKRIVWRQSKRLLAGSIVCLSKASDMFKTMAVIGIVAARPAHLVETNPPSIDLFFPRPEEALIDPGTELFMIEDRASYFEATRHTMKALRRLSQEPFPLQKHIVSATPLSDDDAPRYLRTDPRVKLSGIVQEDPSIGMWENVDVLRDWPSDLVFGMDQSQQEALHRLLTKQIAIVQGPPGTGKTYVSVVLLKVLMDNLAAGDSPIVIACQTNHALDQILRKVAEFAPDEFIRLGGRSQDTGAVKRRILFEVKQNERNRMPALPGNPRGAAICQMRALEQKIRELLSPLEQSDDLLDHSLLMKLGLLTPAQCLSLEAGDTKWSSSIQGAPCMLTWAGKSVGTAERLAETSSALLPFEDTDLEYEQIEEVEAEFKAQDDDDIEALKGTTQNIHQNHERKKGVHLSESEIRRELARKTNMWDIANKHRGCIYEYLAVTAREKIIREVRKHMVAYEKAVISRQIGAWEQDALLLRQAKLIGCTTTGLAKYRGLLNSLSPRIVLIEEAAETLEGPVAAGLLPSLEHLILVGDHRQLRPHVNVRELEDYFLDVSMFERLVLNNVGYSSLRLQRRMAVELRRGLRPIYGNLIKDHPTVKSFENRPLIPGMSGNNHLFFTHNYEEKRDDLQSSFNEFEADMIVQLFEYLVLNGMPAEKITVLTFYQAQRKRIFRCLAARPILKGSIRGIPVVTVDSFQGEENDIVLLSLVRNNFPGNLGFVDVVNRVCVALSRARRGLYIFGNAEMMATESKVWSQVISYMIGDTGAAPRTGRACRVVHWLHLFCEKHGRFVFVNHPEDFQQLNGGCDIPCTGTLECGHRCPMRCHSYAHEDISCMEKCSRKLACGHGCSLTCEEDDCYCELCGKTQKRQLQGKLGASGSSAGLPLRRRAITASSSSTEDENPRRKQTHQWTVDKQGESSWAVIADPEPEPKIGAQSQENARAAPPAELPKPKNTGLLIDFDD